MTSKNYLLSIVTVNLNNKVGLRKTIESVISQRCLDFEYIIIDGGSNDGSAELIQQFSGFIDFSVSEPDTGIYNAMNKGIKASSGNYILFLNSGDYLYDNNVVYSFLKKQFFADFVCGNIFHKGSNMVTKIPETLSFKFLFTSPLPHQAMFIKRSCFFDFGLYNEDFKIVSDWLFYTAAFVQKNASYCMFDRVISVFDENGISTNKPILNDQERDKGLEKYFPLLRDDYEKMLELERELAYYKNSKKFQLLKKIADHKFSIKLGRVATRLFHI